MFSNTVSASMKFMVADGKVRCQANITADFLKQVDDVFGLFNVRAYGKKRAFPISNESTQQLQLLSDFKYASGQ